MSYVRLATITKEVYGIAYDAHQGLMGALGMHTFLVPDEELADYAKGELHAFLIAGGEYHPNPGVILRDLVHRGFFPAGTYLI